VLFRIMLSEVPRERAGVGSGVMATTQQATLALGVASVGSLFLALIGPWGVRDALLVSLLVLLGLIVLTTALSLRLPQHLLRQADRATSVAGTPEFSHSDTAACRRSHGRRLSGERHCACGGQPFKAGRRVFARLGLAPE
jgi:hypothetical protein